MTVSGVLTASLLVTLAGLLGLLAFLSSGPPSNIRPVWKSAYNPLCTYTAPNGNQYNFNPLTVVNGTDYTYYDPNTGTYFINICAPANNGFERCSPDDQGVCEQGIDGQWYGCGTGTTWTFYWNTTTQSPVISYTGGTVSSTCPSGARLSYIELVCDQSYVQPQIVGFSQAPTCTYNFVMRAAAACASTTTPTPPPTTPTPPPTTPTPPPTTPTPPPTTPTPPPPPPPPPTPSAVPALLVEFNTLAAYTNSSAPALFGITATVPTGLNHTTIYNSNDEYSLQKTIVFDAPTSLQLVAGAEVNYVCTSDGSSNSSLIAGGAITLNIQYNSGSITVSGTVYTMIRPMQTTSYTFYPVTCANALPCTLSGIYGEMVTTVTYLPQYQSLPFFPNFNSDINPVAIMFPTGNLYQKEWALVQSRGASRVTTNYGNSDSIYIAYLDPEESREAQLSVVSTSQQVQSFVCPSNSKKLSYYAAFQFDFFFSFNDDGYELSATEYFSNLTQPAHVQKNTGSNIECYYGITCKYSMPADSWTKGYLFFVDVPWAPQ